MKKIIMLFSVLMLVACSREEVNYTAQFTAASPCSNTPLGITEASRIPWPGAQLEDPSQNIWRWCKRNDTLYVFMSQFGIDSRVTKEYAFIAKSGKCVEPLQSSLRDTYDEMNWETLEPGPQVLYQYPFTTTIQYYVENLFLVGRFVEKVPGYADISTDVWVNFSPDTEKPDYHIKDQNP